MKQAIAKMKTLVKADAQQGRAITARINSTPHGTADEQGCVRARLWQAKRAERPARRARLLAYAMLRGMPYARVEPKCSEPIHEYAIHVALRAAVADIDMVRYSRESIESWLLGRGARSKAA
jgi:hypothetical protein